MKTKRKFLAEWVQIIDPNSPHFKKCGVIMDDDYLHNGVVCFRVISGPDVITIEPQHLKLIQM